MPDVRAAGERTIKFVAAENFRVRDPKTTPVHFLANKLVIDRGKAETNGVVFYTWSYI